MKNIDALIQECSKEYEEFQSFKNKFFNGEKISTQEFIYHIYSIQDDTPREAIHQFLKDYSNIPTIWVYDSDGKYYCTYVDRKDLEDDLKLPQFPRPHTILINPTADLIPDQDFINWLKEMVEGY